MPTHYNDQAEVEVFTFWIDRLAREFRHVRDQVAQERLVKSDQRLLRGRDYGKDADEFARPRHKL